MNKVKLLRRPTCKRFLSKTSFQLKNEEFGWFEEKVYNAKLKTIPAKMPRWMDKSNLEKRNSKMIQKTGLVLVEEITEKLEEMAAIDVNVIDVSSRVDHIETVVICEGRSARHVYSIADAVRIMAKNRYIPGAFMPPNLAIEGKDNEDWLVLDLGKIMVHCFTPEARQEIDLDSLWTEEFQTEQRFSFGREYERVSSWWVL